MSVELFPNELGFKRPFTHEVSQVLRLQNPNSDPVAFKVKTTAPKQYCVRPNSGRIEPGRDVEVQVLLQAMKEDPAPDARCRDKFLVQSVAIASGQDVGTVSQIWANIEQTAKGSIQEKKIRVTFLPADGAAAPATNGVSHHDEEPSFSSPTPAAVTPQRVSSAAATANARSPTQNGALNQATAAVANATGVSEAELRRQLEESKNTIARLQQQAAEATGLRQRKPEDSRPAALPVRNIQAPPPAAGVPIPIVAVLCALIFLIAYLFF